VEENVLVGFVWTATKKVSVEVYLTGDAIKYKNEVKNGKMSTL